MFDLVHKHKHVAQGILALITLPFAFFGVDYYFNRGDRAQSVATVGGDKITQQEFDDLLRDQQQRMRQALGAQLRSGDARKPRSALRAARPARQPAAARAARARGIGSASATTQLQQFIAGLPPFQEDGKFSPDKYGRCSSAQGMSPLMFEQRVRGELVLSPLQDPIVNGSIAAQTSVQRYLALLEQKRDVAVASIPAEPFVKIVKVERRRRQGVLRQESDRVPDARGREDRVPAAEPGRDRGAGQGRPAEGEAGVRRERQAVHDERGAAGVAHPRSRSSPTRATRTRPPRRRRPTALLDKARAKPDAFAELAKANSQDTGSAAQGGDLGIVRARRDGEAVRGRGVRGEGRRHRRARCRSDFGYHVIKVTGITPAHVQTFDEVKAEDRGRPQAAEGRAEVRRGRRPVPEPRLRAGGFARRCGEGARPQGRDDAVHHARAGAGGGARQREVRAGAVLARIDAEQAQHRGDRSRSEHADGRPHRRVQAGGAASVRRRAGRDPPAARAHSAASELAQKAGREKLALLEQGKSDRKPASRSASRSRWCATSRSRDLRPMRSRRSSRPTPRSCPRTSARRTSAAAFRSTRSRSVIDAPAPDAAKLQAAGARVGSEIGRELMTRLPRER